MPTPRAGEIDLAIGKRIKEARIARGLNQQQFGELIGVSYQQAHKYEKGINRVAASRLVKIAAALQVSVEDLAVGDGAPPATDRPGDRMRLEVNKRFVKLPTQQQRFVLMFLKGLAGELEPETTTMGIGGQDNSATLIEDSP